MTETERRKFLKLVGASLAGAAGMNILGCTPDNIQEAADVPVSVNDDIDTPLPEYDAVDEFVDEIVDTKTLRREELTKRLVQLAWSETPTDLRGWSGIVGCYVPVSYETIRCPDCDEVMRKGEMKDLLHFYDISIQRIRELHLDAKLIPPEHCSTCGFGLKKAKFHVEIRYLNDPDVVRVELDSDHDLVLMALFLEGEDRYGAPEGEVALKHKVARLRKLFGIKADVIWPPETER